METSRPLNPAALPSGTEVGPWRVVGLQGRGTYGTVYRAEKIGDEHAGPVALKLAVYPMDPRFEREGELLWRLSHPHVPRLLDRGWWNGPGGTLYPYIVMAWVEGVPLYAWAAQHGGSRRQGMRVLAQVASALAATHAVEGVHRDVKGENVLVREDGKAVLLDFGSADLRGARTLTRSPEPPGTPQYWSPESLRFQWEHRRHPTAHYEAGPADDVYALGMMAWKLVTGSYPAPTPEPEDLENSDWLNQPVLLPPEALEASSPELKALILQMLSSEPSARGSAAEVAQALERAAEKAEPKAERPLLPGQKPVPTVRPTWTVALHSARAWRRGLSVTAAGVLVALILWKEEPQPPMDVERPLEVAQEKHRAGGADAGTSELADTAVTERANAVVGAPGHEWVALNMPKSPLPGQRHPPCKPPAIAVNGGCWRRLGDATPPCDDDSYVWGNGCYLPVLATSRPPTSEPR